MTGEKVVETWKESRALRQLILDLAHAFTRDTEQQKRLVTFAWIAIGEDQSDRTEDHYMRLAYRVMRHRYELYFMDAPRGKRSNDAGIQRARRRIVKVSG